LAPLVLILIMYMKLPVLIYVLLPFLAGAQVAGIKAIKINSLKFADTAYSVQYPFISLPNATVAKSINVTIKKTVFAETGYENIVDVKKALAAYSKDFLLEMSFKVIFNKSGILSLEIYFDVQGAYENSFYRHLTFNTATGKQLTLSDIIKASSFNNFKQDILNKKRKALQQYAIDIKKDLDSNYISKEEYDESLSLVKNGGCADSVSLQEFTISNSCIQVYDDCDFPHAMRAQQPGYELKYFIDSADKMINKQFLDNLIQK